MVALLLGARGVVSHTQLTHRKCMDYETGESGDREYRGGPIGFWDQEFDEDQCILYNLHLLRSIIESLKPLVATLYVFLLHENVSLYICTNIIVTHI